MNNQKNEKKIKPFVFIILFIGVVSIGIGVYCNLMNGNLNKEIYPIHNSKNIPNGDMVIKKEERYVNEELKERITYSYKGNGLVKSSKLLYNCKNYEYCTIMEPYALGLYKYKYRFDSRGYLKNIIVIDAYTLNGKSLYLDENLKYIKKYSYTETLHIGETRDITVKYKYDDLGRIEKRTAYKNDKVNSVVSFKYDDNNNIILETFSYKNGTKYRNIYTYDDYNNVTKFIVRYTIKPEDEIIVSSDGYEGMGSKGSLEIKYDYKYEDDLISEIIVNATINDYSETLTVTREYDENKNLVLETVISKNNKITNVERYQRKIYYEKNKKSKENNYKKEIVAMQTNSDSFVDYLYKEDNWLGYFRFYL